METIDNCSHLDIRPRKRPPRPAECPAPAPSIVLRRARSGTWLTFFLVISQKLFVSLNAALRDTYPPERLTKYLTRNEISLRGIVRVIRMPRQTGVPREEGDHT